MEDDLGYQRKLEALRAAIKEGDESGIAPPGRPGPENVWPLTD